MATLAEIVTGLRSAVEAIDVSAYAHGTGLTSLALTEAVSGEDGSWLGVDHLSYMVVFGSEAITERQSTGTGQGEIAMELHVLHRVRASYQAADRLADQLDGWAVARDVVRAVLDVPVDGDVGVIRTGPAVHLGAAFGSPSDIHVWRIPLTITCTLWS